MPQETIPFSHYKRSRLDGAIRRHLIPSVSKLTYNRLFQVVLNSISFVAALPFPEFRKLPPAHLRARVGTGNRLFFNHPYYMTSSIWFWLDSFSRGLLNLSSAVVEIGCGSGRVLQHLHDTNFEGTFTGIDIDDELLEWCRRSFTRSNFRFLKSSHRSISYSSDATTSGGDYWKIPLADESTQFVYSCSLLSHLLEPEVQNYLAESFRILKKGGALRMSFFCLETVEKNSRWTFAHRIGNAHVESLKVPEAAVAYTRAKMESLCREAGFSDILFRPSVIQSEVICRK